MRKILGGLILAIAFAAPARAASSYGGGMNNATDPTKLPLTGGTLTGPLFISTVAAPATAPNLRVSTGQSNLSGNLSYVDVEGIFEGIKLVSQDNNAAPKVINIGYTGGGIGSAVYRGAIPGGTENAPLQTISGSGSAFQLQGHNGTGLVNNKAQILMNASENWGLTNTGTEIDFKTTPVGLSNPNVVTIFNSTGITQTVGNSNSQVVAIGISTTTGAGDLSSMPIYMAVQNSNMGILGGSGLYGSSITFSSGGMTLRAATMTMVGGNSGITINTILNGAFTVNVASGVSIQSGGQNPVTITAGSSVTINALQVTSSGNIAIGTTNPTTGSGLEINLTSPFATLVRAANTNYGLIRYFTAGVEDWRIGEFTNSTSDYNIMTGANAIYVTVLKSNGNVGIGTTSPLSKLDVSGGLAIGTYAGANAAPANGAIISGSVGIGTTNPTSPLTVAGAISGSNGLTISSGNSLLGTSSGTQLFYCNGGASVGNLCRGNGCSCTAGSWVGMGVFVP